jgi:hypothetical protein
MGHLVGYILLGAVIGDVLWRILIGKGTSPGFGLLVLASICAAMLLLAPL